MPKQVLGVDGRPGGWLAALVELAPDRPPEVLRWLLLDDAAAVLAVPATVTAVDVPIGLPDSGPRDCDLLARRRIAPRGSCVFPAPVRAVLAAGDYDQARRLSVAASGRSVSRQTWNIVDKIRDFDAALAATGHHGALLEVHPEVSFAALAGQVLPPKRHPEGRAARLAALDRWLGSGAVERLLGSLPRGTRAEDALDALATAWTAARWVDGSAEGLPPGPAPTDTAGRTMQIVV